MSMGVERYQALKGPLTVNPQGTVVQAQRSFGERVTAFFDSTSPAAQRFRAEDGALANAFLADLRRSGQGIADAAMQQVLGAGRMGQVLAGTARLTHGERKEILAVAQQMRATVMRQNEALGTGFLNAAVGGFAARHAALAPPGVAPTQAVRDAVLTALRQHPDFARQGLSPLQIQQIANTAIQEFYTKQDARFVEAFPGLGGIQGRPHGNDALLDRLATELDRTVPDPHPGVGSVRNEGAHMLGNQFLDDAHEALGRLRDTRGLLGQMHYDPPQAAVIRGQLQQRLLELQASENALARVDVQTPRGQELQLALIQDLQHQQQLLTGRIQVLDAYIAHDPLSNVAVAQNDLVWAEAQGVIIDKMIARLSREEQDPATSFARVQQLRRALDGDPTAPPNTPQAMGLRGFKTHLIQEATNAVALARANPQRSTVPPEKYGFFDRMQVRLGQKPPHPFDVAASTAKRTLQDGLRAIGINETAVKLAGKSMPEARQRALDTAHTWQTVTQPLVVTRDGVTRTYTSHIIPGRQLGGAVGRGLANDGLQGVSAGNKSQTHHARNLQVSRLTTTDPTTGQVKVMSQHVRHGVIDAWMIADEGERARANRRAAKEVLTTAVEHTTPRRFKDALLAKATGGMPGAPPSKLTHVNFNLTTPASIREWGAEKLGNPDYSEKTYTEHQFQAFDSHRGPQELRIDDDRAPPGTQDQRVQLEVDTITFSFGVNDLAMGKGLKSTFSDAGWANVEKHNRANMQKLLGDLAENTAPGGVIGETIQKIDAALAGAPPNAAELRKLRQSLIDQTNTVRQMFNSGHYKTSEGDPYQMVRHTMRLVDTSAQALAELGDQHAAITVSQGCKSGKDRGGMADVENKAQAIIEDMGGKMEPDVDPTGEDAEIYRATGVLSGQQFVQEAAASLPGSKNAKEVRHRIGDPDAVRYMKGFADHSKA